MYLLSLLPFGCLYCLFLILYNRNKDNGIYTAARRAMLQAILIICVYFLLITEVLSAFRLISFPFIASAWAIPLIILAFYAVKKRHFAKNKEILTRFAKLPAQYPVYWFIAALLLISFIAGVLYPVNNYDSLTYHMARVEHWRQNQSIWHYQTHILRQLVYPPFDEWVILHARILTGGDRLANAVQLFFMAGCLLNASLITKELGGNAKQQTLSVLFTCLLPMAIIQSNTTQNDVVVAFFILAFVYFTVKVFKQLTISHLYYAGFSLGLAWLTKGTAYVFTLMFIGWYGIIFLTWYGKTARQLMNRLLLLMIVPALALTMNSPHYFRNIQLTGSPLGNASEHTGNEGMNIKSLAMVGFKNILNHMPVNNRIKSMVVYHSRSIGIDANDQKYSYNTMEGMVTGFSFHEDYAQNFVHVLLIIITCVAFLTRKRIYKRPFKLYTLYFCTIAATALLFTVLLKWQPWSNRLETALFMLFCVFLAMEISNWNRYLRFICALSVSAYGTAALLLNENHPILPVTHSIFAKPYKSFIDADNVYACKAYLDQKPYTRLGIFLSPDSPDYYYLKLLSESSSGQRRELKHILVKNASEIYADDFMPEAIVRRSPGPESFNYKGKEFVIDKIFGDEIWFYVPK